MATSFSDLIHIGTPTTKTPATQASGATQTYAASDMRAVATGGIKMGFTFGVVAGGLGVFILSKLLGRK